MRTDPRRPGRRWHLLAAASLVMLSPLAGKGQSSPELKEILQRLDRLEASNRALTEEVRSLRTQLASEEKVAVLERRVEEQAQTKVEASQRFPIRITGMALFNTYLNSQNNSGSQYPTVASRGYGRTGGAGFRQSIIGLEYRGPETIWGGKVNGSLSMDLFAGSGQVLDQLVRLRTASIGIGWKQRSVLVGLEKPLIAQRDPTSLAQVGVSPLTGAGNLWLWIPQVRIEQGLRLGDEAGLRAQIAFVQTREQAAGTVGGYTPEVEKGRPGIEGRFPFHYGSERRIEVAPGFHYSVSHAGGASIPSSVFSLDWLASPWRPVELTGTFFSGQNVAHLGAGGAGPGYNVAGAGLARAVHSQGGWGQVTLRATRRVSVNMFTGQHDNRVSDLLPGQVENNLMYGANIFYRLAPNVLVSVEASQVRTTRSASGRLLSNHYDLALAYLF